MCNLDQMFQTQEDQHERTIIYIDLFHKKR